MSRLRLNLLKGIEICIYLTAFFIIFYDWILPEAYADAIFSFGSMQFGLLSMLFWVTLYFAVGIHEAEYLKKKFNKTHFSKALVIVAFCIFLYLSIYIR